MNKKEKDSELKSKFNKGVISKLSVLIIAAIASYAFYFLMARMLSIEDYGLLYSLIALTYLFTVPHETIRTVMARYTVDLATKKKYGKIKYFFIKTIKKIFIYSLIAFAIFLALSPLLTNFLHASLLELAIIGSSLLVAFLLPVIWGLLQGLQKFGHLGINNSIEGIAKLIIATILVSIGLGVSGALISVPLSMLIAFVAGFWPIKKIIRSKAEPFKEKYIIRYSIAAFIIFLFFVAMYSIDVMMARYFFSAKLSGLYSSISLISKFVLFISITITRVMFSTVAEQSQKYKTVEEKYKKGKAILLYAGTYILILIGIFMLISIIAPELIIKIVVGEKYVEVAPILRYMILAMGFLSLSSLIIFYNLSIDWNKRFTARILGTFLFLLIALLIVFHDSITQFVTVVLFINILLFLALILTLFNYKNK
ncbi:MAG: oligosaccharide flippase family protein [Candidatus Pacearchaeota archaeon]